MGEVGRRLVHASGVVVPGVFLVGLVPWEAIVVGLILGTVLAIGLEILRLKVGLDWWIYRRLTRPYEADRLAGYALYMIGITAVAAVFRWEVAVPAMLMLMVGDPISGSLSTGELRTVKRPIAMGAMLLVCLAFALPFTIYAIGEPPWAFAVAVFGAAAATVADGVKLRIRGRIVDDNLTIPIAGGIGLWVGITIATTV